MIPYIICFFISVLFTYIAEINFKKENKKIGILFSVFAIFVPCFLAGIRSESVGNDVKGYISRTFMEALSNRDFWTFSNNADVDFGYSSLVYIITIFTDNISYLHFITELIICFFIYYTLYKERKSIPMWFGMLVFYLVFYNISLNLVRQSIAISIFLYSIVTINEKKYLKTLTLFIIGMLFHNTIIFAIPAYVIIYFERSKINKKIKYTTYFVMFILLFICLFNYEEITRYLAFDLGILDKHYTKYFYSEYTRESIDISFFGLIYRIFWIIASTIYLLINKKYKKNYKIDIDVECYILLIIEIMIFTISFKIGNAFRVGHYYQITAMILLIPKLRKIFKKDMINQGVGSLLIILILFICWYYDMINGGSGTYPYISDIISILN